MKHNEQSQQTKQELSLALKKLMESKPISRITIRELVEMCGVNRKTFYYHFEDIYDLLKWTLEQEALSFFDQYDLVNDNSRAVEFVMDYIGDNLDMLQNIVRSIGRSELGRFFFKDIYQPVYRLVSEVEKLRGLNVGEGYKAFLSKFLTEAIAGILLDCIERDALDDRQRLSRYITDTLTASIANSLEAAAKHE